MKRLASATRLFFLPAIAVLGRLTYARKFVFISLVVALPVAALLGLQLQAAGERVRFNQSERVGVAALEAVREFARATERHRVLSAAAARGLAGAEAARAEAVRAATAASLAVDGAIALHGDHLQAREPWERIRLVWPAVQGGALHDELARELAVLMRDRIGNYSNLALDPELDSYWLMDAYVEELPRLAEALSRLAAHALSARPGSSGSPELSADAAIARGVALEALDVALSTALREASRLGRGPELARALAPARAALARSLGEAERALGDPSSSPEAALALALGALDDIWALHAQVGPQLDRLIERRVERHSRERLQGVLAAAAVALVCAYLFAGFYLSVRQSLQAAHAPPAGGPAVAPTRDELGEIVVAHSRALGEKQRLEAQLVLSERLATVGRLAAGTAHELNEPLCGILGFAQLAQREPGTPESVRRDLERIAKAALHAREVIRQLMLFARQSPPEKAAIDLNRVVEEALELVSHRREKASIGLARSLAEDLPKVVADPAQMRQVVLNLVVNAVQASRSGTEISVGTRALPEHALLYVEDRGAGMTPEVLQNIFLPFFTTKDVGQGTGLGLSVVHGIVTAHGGTIQVESRPGQGTRFEVRIPYAAPDERAAV